MKELLQFIYEGGSVIRYHARPGLRTDTDASHSFGVALWCSLLAGKDAEGRTQASAMLLMAALTHDLAEQAASDISAPAKRMMGLSDLVHDWEQKTLRKYDLDYEQWLDPEELLILKLADCFDGLLYCCRELALGNKNVMLIWKRFCSYIETLTVNTEVPLDIALRASNMYEAIKEIYRETRSEAGPEFNVFE